MRAGEYSRITATGPRVNEAIRQGVEFPQVRRMHNGCYVKCAGDRGTAETGPTLNRKTGSARNFQIFGRLTAAAILRKQDGGG
jgi:hypothetical protein